MTVPLLEVRDLHAGYGKAEVLRGLSLAAPVGSVIAVIGPNGAGKSTLLNALMGILPMRGEIRFEGDDIALLTLEQRVMRGIALVPEKRELFGTVSVEDNLVLGGWRPQRHDIFSTIDALRRSGVTILLVEQNARAALEVADHGYVLETGDIVLDGPAAALAGDARVVETYLGTQRPS